MIESYNVRVVRAFPPHSKQDKIKVPDEMEDARARQLIQLGFIKKVQARKKKEQ